jgi:hypothetical protein
VYWLVAELVDRLQDVVPEGIAVAGNATGFGVEIAATKPPFAGGAICYVRDAVEQPSGVFERRVEAAAWQVLNTLQDLIAEDTAEPWPDEGRNPLPTVETAVESGVLQLWYGDRDEPVLALRPIPLPDRPS